MGRATSWYLFQRLVGRKNVVNRRLPRITQRDAITGDADSFTPELVLRAAGSFPGAACFHMFRPG
jgi:hypothetical protein